MSDHEAIVTPTPEGFQPHTVAHHYNTHEQEFQATKFAFWLFLATEILLFGGLFAAYFAYHGLYPETFVLGGQQLNWVLGALNTSILLCSSWTMAMGVRSAQLSDKRKALMFLGLTLAGAIGFLIVKYFEYSAKIGHGEGQAKENQWGGVTLDWRGPTPPPLYNFDEPPVVTSKHAYDYSELDYDSIQKDCTNA